MLTLKFNDLDFAGASTLQSGALVRFVLACISRGGAIAQEELAAACGTDDEGALSFVRGMALSVSVSGHAGLTHPEVLAIISRARTRGRAGARVFGVGWGGEDESKKKTVEPPNPAEGVFLWNSEMLETPDARAAKIEIERCVARFRERLDDEGTTLVLRVMDHLSRGHRGPRALSVVRDMWRETLKHPPEQWAFACETFSTDGPMAQGKGFRYLLGIVRRSAQSRYIEERARYDKQRFELEAP